MSHDWATTERVPAEVALADGTVLQGEIHVRDRSPVREGPETPLELLNRPEPFFALSQGGNVVFIAKAQVASVATDTLGVTVDPDRIGAARRVGLEVMLPGGGCFSGFASLEMPPTRGRALDYLNARETFFTVWTHAETRHINRAHVRFVRPID
jgi:hypothetical protein